ncbi:MAG: porin [Fimbriimonadales bacterium]
MSNRYSSILAGAMAACFSAQLAFGQNQGSAYPDTPKNHWAYQAVKDLANKGLVKGYKDGKLIASQDLSRFEFATILNRVVETLDAMVATKNGQPPKDTPVPSPKVLTQDTLNEIQALKDAFQDQLEAIQANVKKAQDDIDSLRSDVSDAKDAANKAQKTADNSYGAGSGRKFSISGYIQTRFNDVSSRDGTLFPGGSPGSSSGYNGNYQESGNPDSFVVRRSRVKIVGAVSPNTKFAVQLDASGLTSGTNQAVTVREGNVAYTTGDGTANNPTFTVGLFANPFGYALPTSSANIIWPDRPLAFNENSEGIFNGQDYDRGFQAFYGPHEMKYTIAFVNGSGRGSNDTDRRLDTILRAAYASKDNTLGVGASYYDGDISFSGSAPITLRKKQLLGFDAQYTSPLGPFAMAEYLSGTFEQRTWMDVPTVKLTTAAAPGNKIAGYYGVAGYTFDMHDPHPWTLAVSYDVLRRSASGPGSGSNWDDINTGFGAIYNLDSATRLKLWYTNPSKVAHPAANPDPKKVGLITAELQVKF